QFCRDNPHPSSNTGATNYTTETAEGQVLVASDADIAIIAHHAARLICDCFAPEDRSKFPFSMYLIGLAKGWVFEAPFATIPISMQSYTSTGPTDTKETGMNPESLKFLLELIQKRDHATTNTTGDNIPAG